MTGAIRTFLALTVLAALFTFCVAQEAAGSDLAEENSLTDDSATLHIRGVIRPYRRIVVRSPFNSHVLQVGVQVGQEVTAETVLVQLDSQRQEREVHLAKTQLEKIRAELKACELGLKQIARSSDQLEEGRQEAVLRLEFAHRPQPPPGYLGRVVDSEIDIIRSPMREKAIDRVHDAINEIDANELRIRSKRSRLLSMREELRQAEPMAQAAVRIAEQRLPEARIAANVKGIIARRFVQPSDQVKAGDALVEVIQTDRLTATLWLPASVATNVDFQTTPWDAKIRASGTETAWHKGRVRNTAPLPHPQTDQAMLDVEIDNPVGGLRAGMWVDAILESSDVAQASRERSMQ